MSLLRIHCPLREPPARCQWSLVGDGREAFHQAREPGRRRVREPIHGARCDIIKICREHGHLSIAQGK